MDKVIPTPPLTVTAIRGQDNVVSVAISTAFFFSPITFLNCGKIHVTPWFSPLVSTASQGSTSSSKAMETCDLGYFSDEKESGYHCFWNPPGFTKQMWVLRFKKKKKKKLFYFHLMRFKYNKIFQLFLIVFFLIWPLPLPFGHLLSVKKTHRPSYHQYPHSWLSQHSWAVTQCWAAVMTHNPERPGPTEDSAAHSISKTAIYLAFPFMLEPKGVSKSGG